MHAQIEVLREVFEEWLRIHNLDYGYSIHTRDQWRARGETVITDAELVIAFENQLVDILNWSGPWEIEEELQELAGGFGYYFEMGHHWNIGFYPLDEVEEWPPLPPRNAPYTELLQDQRWEQKRNRIVDRARGHCEDCGRATDYFEVHHCYYRFNRYPWQYPDASLLALCRECHVARAKIELEWRGFMPRLKTRELQGLKKALDNSLYWFDRQRLFSFLTTLSAHDVKQLDKLRWLLETFGHPEERGDNPKSL
jgi:hypothetical protein